MIYSHFFIQKYPALYDDFASLDSNTLKLIIEKVEMVQGNPGTSEKVYGNICFSILIEDIESKIFSYDELLGKEKTVDVYDFLKEIEPAKN